MTLGEKITQLRKQRQMSQEELAEHMDVSRQAVSKWENDVSKPDTQNLIALAKLLGVDLNELADCERVQGRERGKNILILALSVAMILCFSLSLTFFFLWHGDRCNHDKFPDVQQNTGTGMYWDSVTVTYLVRNDYESVELTDAQQILLSQLVWGQEFTPWSENDDLREIVRGGLIACVEFKQGELTYQWSFTPNAFTYSVITNNGDAISYKYSPNYDFLRMLGNQFVRNGFEDDAVIAATPSDYAPTVGKYTDY